MHIYSIGALLKFILGLIILSILFNYVHVYENTMLGLGFGFLGLFLLVWGSSYFFFQVLWRMFSNYNEHIRNSASYKLSLLLGIYVMVNITLMIIDTRSTFIGVSLVFVFLILQYLITADFKKQNNNDNDSTVDFDFDTPQY